MASGEDAVIVQWKGRGWTVFYVPLALLFAVFGLLFVPVVAALVPDDSDRSFYRFVAIWLFLSGICVYAIDRWLEGRARRMRSETDGPFPETIRDDEFLYMRMWAWPYVYLLLGLAALAASLMA
jgi:hypothetical protein